MLIRIQRIRLVIRRVLDVPARTDVLGESDLVAEQLGHLLERLAARLRVEHEEAERGDGVAAHEHRVVAPADRREGLGRELVEEEADAGAHEGADWRRFVSEFVKRCGGGKGDEAVTYWLWRAI